MLSGCHDMPTPGESDVPRNATPDVERLPFAFAAEYPAERRRVNMLSRLLVGGALVVGPTVASVIPAAGRRPLARAWARSLVAAAGLILDITGLDNIDPGQSYLVAPLHESFVDAQGLASMRRVDSVELPPGGEARLEPGGLHVMLMGLDATLSVGDSVSTVLQFEVSGRLTVSAVVRQL